MIWNGKFGYQVKLNFSVDTASANSDPSTSKILIQEENTMETPKTEMVMRVSVKLPPFWRERPEIWFKSVEAQFALPPAITCDLTMYNTVVAALDGDILGHVSDVIMDPPASDKYKTLKNRLVERFSDSEAKRLKKLLADFSLDGRTPSQLLREMKVLASSKVSEDFLKTIWMNSLPQHVRAILSTIEGDLNKMAQTADKVTEITDSPNVAEVTQKEPQTDPKITQIEKQLEELTNLVKSLARDRSNSRSRERSSSRLRDTRPDSEAVREKKKDGEWLCWYHYRFGERAKDCIQPCSFNQKN